MVKNKSGLVGVGAYGGNQVHPFYKANYPSLFINTALTDLKSLTDVEEEYKYHVPGSEGCNKDRNNEMKDTLNSAASTRNSAKSSLDSATSKTSAANSAYSSAKSQSDKDAKALSTATKNLKNSKSVKLTDAEKKKIAAGKSIDTSKLSGKKKTLVQKYNAALKKSNSSKTTLKNASNNLSSAKSAESSARATYNSANDVYNEYQKQYTQASRITSDW